jgi:hypothetical protein
MRLPEDGVNENLKTLELYLICVLMYIGWSICVWSVKSCMNIMRSIYCVKMALTDLFLHCRWTGFT